MKTTTHIAHTALAAVLLLGLSAAPDASAKDISKMDKSDFESEFKSIQKDVDSANAKAQKNHPKNSKSKKVIEEKLDQLERKVDDNPSAKNIKARDEYKKFADATPSAHPDKDEAYREALKEKRAARKRLKDLIPALRKKLSGWTRKDVERILHKGNKALRDAESYPKWRSAPKTTTMNMTDTSKQLAMNNVRNGMKIAVKRKPSMNCRRH